MHETEKWNWSRSFVSYSSRPHGLQPTRLLHTWDFPGKSTGVSCQCLLWHNGYYVIIIENNFQHIKHLFREIWIKLPDIFRRPESRYSLYCVFLGWWQSQSGTFVNFCHFWLSQFGGLHLVSSGFMATVNHPTIYRTGPQPSTVNYLVQNVSKALLEKFTDYSLYIIELLKFIFNNQGSPGFCASC